MRCGLGPHPVFTLHPSPPPPMFPQEEGRRGSTSLMGSPFSPLKRWPTPLPAFRWGHCKLSPSTGDEVIGHLIQGREGGLPGALAMLVISTTILSTDSQLFKVGWEERAPLTASERPRHFDSVYKNKEATCLHCICMQQADFLKIK